jgi:cell division protein FtsW
MIALARRDSGERGHSTTNKRQPATRRESAVSAASAVTRRAPVAPSAVRARETVATARAASPALDYPLIAIVATLLALGLVMVYSATLPWTGADFFIKQIRWIAVGLLVLVGVLLVPYRWWRYLAIPLMLLTLGALVAVLVYGAARYGAQRTLRDGSVQPSEVAKLTVVIYVAAWVASKKSLLAQVQGGLIPFAILMGIIGGLIVLERSFSVTIIILVTGVTMFFVGGGSAKQLGITGLIAIAVLALLIWRSGYGADRIQNWWLTLFDPTKAPYDVAQAMAIIRRGQGIGTDPANSFAKLFVPLLWSDYLFANVGADLGFPGTLAVVILFALLAYRGLGIALNAPDQFGSLAAIGISTWLLTQALIHIGTSLALIPTTGVPLPFMSYGGSAMVGSMAAIGLLLSISRASQGKRASYARFAFGWRNSGPRSANSGSGQRAAQERATGDEGHRGLPAGQPPRKRRRRRFRLFGRR